MEAETVKCCASESITAIYPYSAHYSQAGKPEVQKLKDEGNKYFGRKEYQKALDAYDKALKASDNSATEAPLLHSNKAACFMMMQRRATFQLPLAILAAQACVPSEH